MKTTRKDKVRIATHLRTELEVRSNTPMWESDGWDRRREAIKARINKQRELTVQKMRIVRKKAAATKLNITNAKKRRGLE